MELLTGFLIGLLGSFHCIGMCGPIVLALPKPKKLMFSRLLYNSGRVITYSMLGLLFGLLGSRLQMIGLQQIISVTLGVVIILFVLIPASYRLNISKRMGLYKILVPLKSSMGKLFKNHSHLSMIGIGILNGLLPCGFVYIGVTGAIAIGNPTESMLFMLMFGAGTIPIMLITSMLGTIISINVRQKLTRLLPAFSLILAVIFILRGLNLGIPYISPKFEKQQVNENVMCH